jgi:hypothetical protein
VLKTISGDTGSIECFGKVAGWLNECEENHTLCKTERKINAPLPTRVLDVLADGVRLLETEGQIEKYVCLSHRWIEGHTTRTTASNLEQRKIAIVWNELPKTYQDAIVFTRRLGLRYLWIDSLCIIQGTDSDDWSTEAPKMGRYYRDAYITISAGSAVEVGDGCFKETSKGEMLKVRSHPSPSEPPTEWVARLRKPLFHEGSPLHYRGWVYQEHLLSARVVHFGDEVVWECAQVTKCECGHFPLNSTEYDNRGLGPIWSGMNPDIGESYPQYGRKRAHLAALHTRPELLQHRWYDMVGQYTRRKLTYDSDIFPALAGLAKQMMVVRKSSYLAGLWKDSMSVDLLWRCRCPSDYSRPREWRAPTWSWAASKSPVDYYHLVTYMDIETATLGYTILENFLEFTGVTCVPVNPPDPTMSLKSATLSLRGPLFTTNTSWLLSVNPPPEDEEALKATMMDRCDELNALFVPTLGKPVEDINFSPWSRNISDRGQHLTIDLHVPIMTEVEESQMEARELEFWPDVIEPDVLAVEEKDIFCLLAAKTQGGFLSLVLRRKGFGEDVVYERIGLLRHQQPLRDNLLKSGLTLV